MAYAAASEGAPSSRLSSSGVVERCFGHLQADLAFAHEPGQGRVHRLHPDARAGLQDGVDLVGLALADQVAHGRRGHEHLAGDHAPGPVGGRDQLLGHDPLQRHGQLHPHLVLLRGGEHVDDAVDRLGGVLGVERAEHEVPGLGRRQGGADRLEVAHLADQDHVGVLAQGGLQGGPEALGVGAELALVDDALLVPVQELDRVLDREDVLLAGAC